MWGIGKVIDVLEIIYNEAEKEWCDDSKYREIRNYKREHGIEGD